MESFVDFKRGRWSPATQAVYEIAWRHFTEFCSPAGFRSLPAEPATVAAFLRKHAETHSTATVSQALAAIRAVHKDAKGHLAKLDPQRELYVLDDPIISDAWRDICRTKGTAKTPKTALDKAAVHKAVANIPKDRLLDKAIILFAFASAMRRSEIVALNIEDLEFSDDGITVFIRRSKADKEGKGATVAIHRAKKHCPVEALEAYLEANQITDWAVFRNRNGNRLVADTVAQIAKKWAASIGLRPEEIGAHSLRRGCITTMHKAGIDINSIMAHSRHSTVDIALGYVQKDKAMANPGVKALAE